MSEKSHPSKEEFAKITGLPLGEPLTSLLNEGGESVVFADKRAPQERVFKIAKESAGDDLVMLLAVSWHRLADKTLVTLPDDPATHKLQDAFGEQGVIHRLNSLFDRPVFPRHIEFGLTQNGLPYLLIERLPVGSLWPFVRGKALLPHQANREILHLRELRKITNRINENKWQHCDIKPGNLGLDNQGRIMLSDNTSLVKLGKPVYFATNEYLPPEKLKLKESGQVITADGDLDSYAIDKIYRLAISGGYRSMVSDLPATIIQSLI